MKALRWSMLAVGLALAVPSVGTVGAAQAKKRRRVRKKCKDFWGKLNRRRASRWARKRVMCKGYLARYAKRVARKHPAYAKAAAETLKRLNAQKGKCGKRWPNFRMALAQVLSGARRGAGTALSGVMKPVLDAIAGGCAKVGSGGVKAAIAALTQAHKDLKGKASKRLLRRLRAARGWLRRGSLWWTPPKQGKVPSGRP